MEEYEDITATITKDIEDIKNKITKKEFIVGDSGYIIKEILEKLFIIDNKINKLHDKLNNIKNSIIKRLIIVEEKIDKGGII